MWALMLLFLEQCGRSCTFRKIEDCFKNRNITAHKSYLVTHLMWNAVYSMVNKAEEKTTSCWPFPFWYGSTIREGSSLLCQVWLTFLPLFHLCMFIFYTLYPSHVMGLLLVTRIRICNDVLCSEWYVYTSQPVLYSGWAKTSIAFSILVMAIARCSADKKVYHIPQVFTDVQVTSQMFQNDLIFLLLVIDCVMDSNEYNYMENR